MRITVDVAPQSARPAHAAAGTGCDRFDQGTLAIGIGPTTVKRESPGDSFADLARFSIRQPS
jgi:hypothetical protein